MKILFSFALVSFIFFCSYSLTYAEEKFITLRHSDTVLLHLDKKSKSAQLYSEGKLDLYVKSEIGVELKKRDDTLVFAVPFGVSSGTGTFIIGYKDLHLEFPFTVDIQKNNTDFSIYKELFQKNIQGKALSCESSATADIIATLLGENVTESTIIGLLPKSNYYNKLPETNSKKRYWGNPNQGFVGFINNYQDIVAKQKLYTGYGVYEKPITEVYQSYGLKTEILNGNIHSDAFPLTDHLGYLLGKLETGSMVQLWGDWCTRVSEEDGTITSSEMTQEKAENKISGKNECYNVDDDRRLSWYYKDDAGNEVLHIGLDGEHAFILLGWKGKKENPTHIRVWDTNTGYHEYTIQEWLRKWKLMNYRSIVISRN